MPWIESHSELRDHPKAKRMKRKLKISEHETVGILHYFWYWALEFASDGVLTGMSADDIADGCRYDGDSEELISALIYAGFVDDEGGERTIHDWFKHGGKLVVWRQKEAARAQANRDKNKKNPVNTEDVRRTLDVRTPDVQGYVPTSYSYSNSNKEIKEKDMGDSNESPSRKKRFVKPELHEVTAYCEERKNGVDPNRWMDHYIANGWKIGRNKTPMNDWKAAVRTWERNSTPQTGQSTSPPQIDPEEVVRQREKELDVFRQLQFGGMEF
jgi:hypothetical protein